MSGKGRQPRVKGNLKPTSSSRAADLLDGDMAAINAFKANPALAFSQLSRAAPSTPRPSSKTTTPDSLSRSSTPGPALDQIDGHLASQLKRLGKHDSKTKMRALFELKGYVTEHTWEDGLEGMMLAWPPLFRKHVFDPDRRVRAAVATVNAALVKSAGKRLAPNLKQLIGPWIASYFDPHREVAKTSKKAYETVFPESRRKEVFAYCMEELVDFAVDNIVNQTPETLSDPRFADAEEMKSKFEQVIGASFGILGLVVEEVDSERVVGARAKFDEVLGSKKAMQFMASPATFVRRAVYRFIRSVMLKCPQLAQDSYLQLTQVLVSNAFIDNDPTAHGDMWDAVLLTTKNYPQAWSEITAKGKKTPPVARVFAFLTSRCRMAPTISYPSILALLANLPADIIDEPTFSSEFRSALWQGAAASDEAAAATKIGAKAAQVESISLVSALCECLSFLWQRSLKTAGAVGIDGVCKEAAQELDRLWHYYLQNGEVAEEMSGAFVSLYCKIEALAEKYGAALMDKIWAQTSWFALKRLSGDSAAPVVHLVAQIRALDATQHGLLAENAKKLVVAFCQLAAQSPDDQTAQSLIQTLAQLAPDVVFREGFADKFSVRLEKSGACDEAIDLVLSKAQYVMTNTESLAEAVASLDEFVRMPADSAEGENGSTLRLVTALLKALPGSQISQNDGFASARLPSLDALIVSSIPKLPANADDILSASVEAPESQLLQLYSQALQLAFCGTELVSRQTVSTVFGWMESIFKMQYEIQWEGKKTKCGPLDSWIRTIYDVLSSWAALASDRMAGPRFVRFWLARTNNDARSALGLLFDMALSSAHGETSHDSTLAGIAHAKLYPQAKRAWSATESQLEKLHLGSELAHALSESISEDLGDLATPKNPSHLARLAHSVFTRICPQDDAKAIKSLVRRWLLDERVWKSALLGDALAVLGSSASADDYLGQTVLGSAALSQAINESQATMSLSFHSLGQWSVASLAGEGLHETEDQLKFDMFGLSRFARHAMFSVEFMQLSGGLTVLSDASNEAVATLILNMTLAYVLLRETLAAYKHDAEDSDSAAPGSVGTVQLDNGDNVLHARVGAAAKEIEGTVSDLLSLLVVHGSSLPKPEGTSDDEEESEAMQIKVPRDSGRWLSTLMSRILSASDDSLNNDVSESVWDILIATCVERHRQAPQSQWGRVLATLSEWCQWANPLISADVEAAMAVPLSTDLGKVLELPALIELTTLVARSVSLRHACSQSPALRGTLIDLVGYLTRTINGKASSLTSLGLKLVVALELLAELLPPQAGSLDVASSTPKIMQILVAIPELLSDAAAPSTVSLALTLAALEVMRRFSDCVPAIDDVSAVGLVRQCLRWLNYGESLEIVEQQHAVLVAVSCAVSSLVRMARSLVDDISAVGPVLRQIGDHLVSSCVVSERPVPEGVAAVTALVANGFFDVPGFDTLYPVMISATPRLDMELLRLVLSSSDVAGDIGEHIQSLVGLVSLAAKTLENLHVPYEEFGETIETDEYVRNTGFRLLASMLLVTRCADTLASDYDRYEELAEKLSNSQILDCAMPWVCALLSIDGVSPVGGYEPRLWDPSEGLDWETWAVELEHSSNADHVFRVLAHQIVYSLAWTFPATYRSWWSGLSAKLRATSLAVEQFTCKHISPLLVEREIARIRQQESDNDDDGEDQDNADESWNMHVRAEKPTAVSEILEEYDDATIKAGGTQVTMTYTVDDSTLEISVRVPATYPLSLPTIESMKRVAVTEKRWRSWLVAAQAQMSRNRRLDAVCAQILGNVGAHFAGVEDCAICYSAVGALDNSLPTKQCKTCKHKFHRMCLFKWFSTSNQSSCPLCRNLF